MTHICPTVHLNTWCFKSTISTNIQGTLIRFFIFYTYFIVVKTLISYVQLLIMNYGELCSGLKQTDFQLI